MAEREVNDAELTSLRILRIDEVEPEQCPLCLDAAKVPLGREVEPCPVHGALDQAGRAKVLAAWMGGGR